MENRTDIISSFYRQYPEESRLVRSRHGQLEYAVTMHYIHRFAKAGSRVMEVGAGTGRYSIALAEEGMDVTAVELVRENLDVLRENSRHLSNLHSCQGDAVDLSEFPEDTFDVTLVLGPLYHLYEKEEVGKALDEAVRITKKGGILIFAFISVYGIMNSNYFYGNWKTGLRENFTEDWKVKHFAEQLFTGYDVTEFEALLEHRGMERLITAGVDYCVEPLEERGDFSLSDEEFASFLEWYLHFCETRELLGGSNHLICICRKQ